MGIAEEVYSIAILGFGQAFQGLWVYGFRLRFRVRFGLRVQPYPRSLSLGYRGLRVRTSGCGIGASGFRAQKARRWFLRGLGLRVPVADAAPAVPTIPRQTTLPWDSNTRNQNTSNSVHPSGSQFRKCEGERRRCRNGRSLLGLCNLSSSILVYRIRVEALTVIGFRALICAARASHCPWWLL